MVYVFEFVEVVDVEDIDLCLFCQGEDVGYVWVVVVVGVWVVFRDVVLLIVVCLGLGSSGWWDQCCGFVLVDEFALCIWLLFVLSAFGVHEVVHVCVGCGLFDFCVHVGFFGCVVLVVVGWIVIWMVDAMLVLIDNLLVLMWVVAMLVVCWLMVMLLT